MPSRIQLRRVKGWGLPADAVNVTQPTKWGNPFRLRHRSSGLVREPGVLTGQPWEHEGRISRHGSRHDYFQPGGRVTVCYVRYGTPAELVELYRRALMREDDAAIWAAWGWSDAVRVTVEEVRSQLAGRDLACWCPVGRPCHADVLLQVANQWGGS